MPYNNIPEIFANAWLNKKSEDETGRIKVYLDLRIFYDNDKDSIVEYLENLLVTELKLFSKESFDRLLIRHRDTIQKILNRLTAGIYENPQIISIKEDTEKKEKSNALTDYLRQINYFVKVKEAFRKTKYFNCTDTRVYWDNEAKRVKLEICTPDMYSVVTKDNDYTKKAELYLQFYSGDSNEVSYYYWSEDEHYIIEGDNKIIPVEGNEGMINPFKVIPFVKLQLIEGINYWGEPNWDLFDTQIATDIKRTSDFLTRLMQSFAPAVGINLNLKAGEGLSPNKIITVDDVKEGNVKPELSYANPNIDWQGLYNDIDFDLKDQLRNQGINAATASLNPTAQSGVSKQIDEVELNENREANKECLYTYEKELIEMIRLVHNTYADVKFPEGEIEVEYITELVAESIDDKKKRREMEMLYGIKSPIDFIMEDREVNRDEALKIFEENKQYSIKTGIGIPENTNLNNNNNA